MRSMLDPDPRRQLYMLSTIMDWSHRFNIVDTMLPGEDVLQTDHRCIAFTACGSDMPRMRETWMGISNTGMGKLADDQLRLSTSDRLIPVVKRRKPLVIVVAHAISVSPRARIRIRHSVRHNISVTGVLGFDFGHHDFVL